MYTDTVFHIYEYKYYNLKYIPKMANLLHLKKI